MSQHGSLSTSALDKILGRVFGAIVDVVSDRPLALQITKDVGLLILTRQGIDPVRAERYLAEAGALEPQSIGLIYGGPESRALWRLRREAESYYYLRQDESYYSAITTVASHFVRDTSDFAYFTGDTITRAASLPEGILLPVSPEGRRSTVTFPGHSSFSELIQCLTQIDETLNRLPRNQAEIESLQSRTREIIATLDAS
jgi:hypothetical protein